jgi:septation ring formation regulator EzrA
LKANETLDDIKIDSIPFDKLSEHIKKLTKQIKQISNSVFTTANWLKQLEKIKGDKDDEIIATQDTLLTFKTKLLNCQLIQSDLYHSMVNIMIHSVKTNKIILKSNQYSHKNVN